MKARFACGLIGAGIQGSRAPALHRAKAQAHGASLEYRLIDLDQLGAGTDALPQLLDRAARDGYCGLNEEFTCFQDCPSECPPCIVCPCNEPW